MAKPIKETPVLTGKDAASFVSKIENTKKVSAVELAKMRDNYSKIRPNIQVEKI